MFRKETDIDGGRWVHNREYISGLQNRNKTNLLLALGSAPPIVEELVPETDQVRSAKSLIIKQVMNTGRWIGNMSGLLQLPGNILSVSQRAQNRIMGRLEFELEQFFLPFKAWARDIVFAYESYTSQYQAGSGLGGMIGGFIGSALGYYYLGPFGAAVFGWIGQVGGALIGGVIEQILTGQAGIKELTQAGIESGREAEELWGISIPGTETDVIPPPGGGGMPFQRAFQDTYRRYRRRGRFVIIKMLDLERRLY